jgi:hypothetical protein
LTVTVRNSVMLQVDSDGEEYCNVTG